jgi:hypothetical protein
MEAMEKDYEEEEVLSMYIVRAAFVHAVSK